jgi:hypothetical protein
MLATDLIMDVRASRTITPDQVHRLERVFFADGAPSTDQMHLIRLIDSYLQRRIPCWAELMARAAMATRAPQADPADTIDHSATAQAA